ncbi:LrgA-associated membrane protein LrgB [Lachnospiraceae bacterium KM106-2]|nr:LrgA-associated membrane protein LrgB [Lachnospiraceae bacterium KM106-2]
MSNILNNPLFGIALSLAVYALCKWISQKTKIAFLNPLLLSIALIIILLQTCAIPLESYQQGGSIINMFLAPATTVLAYSIYKQITLLKKYFIPIAAGCLVGSLTSMISAYFLCELFGLNDQLTNSLLPKSVTTPIAMEVSEQLGGIPSVTVAVVIITGILGSVLCPILIKLFHLSDSIANGVAIGTCSHAVGTSKAIQIGEIEGAMSGIAIGVSGIITVILSLIIS